MLTKAEKAELLDTIADALAATQLYGEAIAMPTPELYHQRFVQWQIATSRLYEFIDKEL